LLDEIEQQTTILEKMHYEHMKCRKGCDLCCIDFSVFPVEFYFILNQLRKENVIPESAEIADNDVCLFLKDHSCTIYQHRPIMCRTHGLPLLYANENGEWELSACELNFTEFDFDEFTDENTLPQDKYNSKLFLMNWKFITEFADTKYTETDLIPIKELGKHLFKTEK
jgi:Fe-S-cluster containining protein